MLESDITCSLVFRYGTPIDPMTFRPLHEKLEERRKLDLKQRELDRRSSFDLQVSKNNRRSSLKDFMKVWYLLNGNLVCIRMFFLSHFQYKETLEE